MEQPERADACIDVVCGGAARAPGQGRVRALSEGRARPVRVRWLYCLVFIHVGTRKVFLSPATYEPNDRWVRQQGRNLLMWLEDNELEAKFLVRDHDSKFSFAFDRLLFDSGIRRVRIPRLAPDANAFAESWIGSFKRECLDHFACFGLGHLDHIGQEYVRFFNRHRPHQGLGNRTLPEAAATGQSIEIPATARVPRRAGPKCR